MLPRETKLIGIAGPSGSGKTVLARALAREYGGLHIESDLFYKRRPTGFFKGYSNWEHPDCIMWNELFKRISDLKAGKTTLVPSVECSEIFDWPLHPKFPILLDGFLLFFDERICGLCDERFFLDADPEIQIARRVSREGLGVAGMCKDLVVPHYSLYHDLVASRATFILDGNKKPEEVFSLARNYLERKK